MNLSQAFVQGLSALFRQETKTSIDILKSCYVPPKGEGCTLLSVWNSFQDSDTDPIDFFQATEAFITRKTAEGDCIELIGLCVSGYMQTTRRCKNLDRNECLGLIICLVAKNRIDDAEVSLGAVALGVDEGHSGREGWWSSTEHGELIKIACSSSHGVGCCQKLLIWYLLVRLDSGTSFQQTPIHT